MLIVGDPVDWVLPMPITLTLWVLFFWLWKKLLPATRRLRRTAALLLAIWFVVISTPAVVNLGTREMEGPPMTVADQVSRMGPADYVIIPSAGSPGVNSPLAILDLGGYQRLMAGIATWKKTGGELVMMGGMAKSPDMALSAIMRRIAIEMGVPADRISIVPNSQSTWEDLSGATRIIAQRFPQAGLRTDRAAEVGEVQTNDDGLPVVTDRAPKIVLVTSAIHMQRTQMTANYLGMKTTPMRSDYRQMSNPSWRAWVPNNGTVWGFRALLHEFIGIHVYRWSGRG